MAYGFTYTLPTITGSHTDFPVLLREDDFPAAAIDGGSSSILNGGGNLRAYTSDAKTTQLPVDVVSFVAGGTPSAEVHIKIPSAYTGATIYIEADAVETVQPAVTNTYGRNAVWADYDLVVHCNSASSPVDSSGNSTVTPNGSITEVSGPFGTALSIPIGSGENYLAVTGGTVIDAPANYPIAVSFWSRQDTPILNGAAIAWGGTDDLLIYPGEDTTPDRTRVFSRDSAADPYFAHTDPVTDISITNWNYFGLGFADTDQRLYVNDEELGGGGSTSASLSGVGPFNSFRIGVWADAVQAFGGEIAEVRVGADTTLSRRQVEYANQSASGAWGAVGAWADAGGGGITGTASGALSALTGSSSGASVNNITGTAAASLLAVTGSSSGTFVPLGITGTASGGLSTVTGDAAGSYTPQAITGAGSGALNAVIGQASGAFSNADFTGAGAGTLQAATGSASGASVSNITGMAEGNIAAVVGDASGTVVNPAITGTGEGTLQAITGHAAESVPGAGGKKKRKPWDEGKGYRRVAEEQEVQATDSEQPEERHSRKITLKPTQKPAISDWPLVALDREIAKVKSAITTYQATPASSQMADDLQRVYEAKIMLRYLENERLRKLEEEALLLLMVI